MTQHRYAMYNRSVWAGISLSQPFEIDTDHIHPDIKENKQYHNHVPYSVILTGAALTEDEIQNLELTDIAAENQTHAKNATFVAMVETLDYVSDKGKKALIDLIQNTNFISTIADVERYGKKYMSQQRTWATEYIPVVLEGQYDDV